MNPVVLTVGGTDSSGGAGLHQDMRSMQCFNVVQRSVVSLVSAQTQTKLLHCEAVSDDMFIAQLDAAFCPEPPDAIKLGALANDTQVYQLVALLNQHPDIPVVWDPVLSTSAGGSLSQLSFDGIATLISRVTVLTPNLPELEYLTGFALRTDSYELEAAHQLLTLGCKHVLVTGGHRNQASPLCDKLYNQENTWQFLPHSKAARTLRGSGCLLASAIASALALHYDAEDAICYAEAVVASGFSVATPANDEICHLIQSPPTPQSLHFPQVIKGLGNKSSALNFPPLRMTNPGLYPVVDSVEWLRQLLPLGSDIIQLRIKSVSDGLSEQIRDAIQLAETFSTQLFINDHWQLALEHNAYGVHLGQDDLEMADLAAIAKAGLRLGISTHGYAELCRVLPLKPSYIALGHIFPTRTKAMPSQPQGTQRLADYQRLCGEIPTVAIGGIALHNIDSVVATGVSSVAVVTAITESTDVPQAVEALKGRIAHA